MVPALKVWLQTKLEEQQYIDLYGKNVELHVAAFHSSNGWMKEIINNDK